MKRFAIAALLTVFACAPSFAWAGTINAPAAAVGDTTARRPAAPREATTPALGAFAGGGGGIYIGGGALVVILLVIIIVILI